MSDSACLSPISAQGSARQNTTVEIAGVSLRKALPRDNFPFLHSAKSREGARINRKHSPVDPHVRKTKICHMYLQGQCVYDDRCNYAHSLNELRALSNSADTSPSNSSKSASLLL